jgi:murein DD-endopeptidase MepM/ murein hydrolase activator NlpD
MRFPVRLLAALSVASVLAGIPAAPAGSAAASGGLPGATAASGAAGSAAAGVVPSATAASGAPVARGSWAWPVASPHPIVRPFIAPATPYGPGHRGIDIESTGAEVFAPSSGVVSFAGDVAGRPVLAIRHPGGLVSSLEPVSSTVAAGAAVSRGELVGTLLPGHCARAPCVHFGVRLDGEYVSPLNYLGGVPRAVLLPTRADGPSGSSP